MLASSLEICMAVNNSVSDFCLGFCGVFGLLHSSASPEFFEASLQEGQVKESRTYYVRLGSAAQRVRRHLKQEHLEPDDVRAITPLEDSGLLLKLRKQLLGWFRHSKIVSSAILQVLEVAGDFVMANLRLSTNISQILEMFLSILKLIVYDSHPKKCFHWSLRKLRADFFEGHYTVMEYSDEEYISLTLFLIMHQ